MSARDPIPPGHGEPGTVTDPIGPPTGSMADTYRELHERVALELELIESNHNRLSFQGVRTTEMADGSQRLCAIIGFIDENGNERYLRIAAPAPQGAPGWALRVWTREEVSGP